MRRQLPGSSKLLLLIVCCLAGRVQTNAQQPVWAATGALGTARTNHTATLLTNGKVLVVGGVRVAEPCCTLAEDAELYDPATGRWSATGSPATPRYDHVAVRLDNGKVLIAGGGDSFLPFSNSAELYDPDTGTWSLSGSLREFHTFHTGVLLNDGRVLIAGGLAGESAEIYNPATNSWSPASSMNMGRSLHSMTLLPDGKALVAGGLDFESDDVIRTSEIYDPATNRWTLTGELTGPRLLHQTTLLANGKVLIVGGGDALAPATTSELYDPATGGWTRTGNLSLPRIQPSLILLPDGKALAAGGTINSAELYDPATGNWTPAAMPGEIRFGQTATLLPNGKVLVVGGNVPFGAVLSSAELFDSGASIITSLSAASFGTGRLAPEAIVAGFGANLAASTQTAIGLPLPTQLAGVRLRVRDVTGAERDAPLLFVSPDQINCQIPPGTANGPATLTVSSGAVGIVDIAGVAPGLFTANANGQGVAAAVALRIKADGSQSFEPVARFDATQNRFVAAPIDLGPDLGTATDQVFLVLYGTGLRLRSAQSAVSVTIGGTNSDVLFADTAPGFAGLDQINVRVPRSLAGRGEVDVTLAADGHTANKVRINIR